MKEIFALGLALNVAVAANALALDRKGIVDNGPISLMDQSVRQLHATIRNFRQLGVAWVRLDFDWSTIERSRGWCDLGRYDSVIRELRDAGIQVLGLVSYTPTWARDGQPSKFRPPERAGDYARFAAQLAARYAPMGVHAWEIWNEENTGQFWQPGPSPSRYVELLRHAYSAIHAADPDAFVLIGGLAQARNTPTSIAAIDFLRLLYRDGARPFFDAVADHPYNSPRMPGDQSSSNNWQRMAATSPSLRSIMSENGDAYKQIWITEYGAPTNGSYPGNQKVVISEERQAQMVAQAYAMVQHYRWAGPLFWYEYQDLCPALATRSYECFYGLVRFDGSPKPSYTDYQSAPNE
jgi:hypothetical protein